MKNMIWLIIFFLALNLGLLILNYFALQKAKQHARGEVEKNTIYKLKFYVQIVVALFGLIVFTIGILSYSSFMNIKDHLRNELRTEITTFNKEQALHADSIITIKSENVFQQGQIELDSLKLNDSLSIRRIDIIERNIQKFSKLQQFTGQFLISDYKAESPSVGLLKISFKDLGITDKSLTKVPVVFVQGQGEFSLQIIETTTEYVKMKVIGSQERFVEMDLLIFTQ